MFREKGFSSDESSKDIKFELSFCKPKKINDVSYIEIESDEPSDKNKIFFAPGFSRTPATFKNTIKEFSNNGRDVVSLDYPRIFGEIKDSPVGENLPKEIQRRATSLAKVAISAIDENIKRGIDKKIDIVGQSLGGIDAIVASAMIESQRPGSISNIVLFNTAGIMGPDSFSQIKERFGNQIKENIALMASKDISDETRENQKIAAREFYKYLLKNPKRAFDEVKAMTSVFLEELIIELKKISNIKVSVIHAVDDKTFPMDMVQEGAKERGLVNAIDGFYSVRGGHNELYLNPEKYVFLVDQALLALEEKKEKSINR